MASALDTKHDIVYINEAYTYFCSANTLVQKVMASTPTKGALPATAPNYSQELTTQSRRYYEFSGVKYWGTGNYYPQNIANLVSNHAYLPSLLRAKKNIALGKYKLYRFTEAVVEGEDVEIPFQNTALNDWLNLINYKKYLREVAVDAVWWCNVFVEAIRNNRGDIVQLNRIDATVCRYTADGLAVRVYETWDDIISNSHYEEIPLYDASKKQKKFILVDKEVYPGSPTYGVNPAYSAKDWIEFANKIPRYKLSVIGKGMLIKYHVKIPNDYFSKMYPDGSVDVEGKPIENIAKYRAEKEQAFYTNLSAYLSGEENANKLIVSKYYFDPATQKQVDGFVIEAIEDPTKYDAFLEDLDATDTRILSSQNMPPSVAAIKTINKLGGGGSETLNDYNIASEVHAQDTRALILAPLEQAMRIQFSQFQNVNLGLRGITLVSKDQHKSGIAQPTPTA
jgi:hypothetical protein